MDRNLFFVRPNKRKTKTSKRVVVAVSRKISQSSVTRHLIKRRITEAFRKHELKFKEPVIITALPAIVRKPFHEIKSAADETIQKLFVEP